MNSFGLGGGNTHVLLKINLKEKVNNGLPDDDLPRVVCFSGRTQEAVNCIIDDLSSRPLDVEHVRLLQEAFKYVSLRAKDRNWRCHQKHNSMVEKMGISWHLKERQNWFFRNLPRCV